MGNIPIVSSMCQKCTLFCRQKIDGGVADEEHRGVRLLRADEGGARAKGGDALRASRDIGEKAKSESKMDDLIPIGNSANEPLEPRKESGGGKKRYSSIERF